ncbi:hypothetical protein K8I28_12930, partial [bacterium]|nr:hypothetical protein [bacterium]
MILIQKQRIFSIAGILLCVLFGNQKPIAVNAAKPSIDQAVATPYFMRNSERIGDRRVDATSGITLAWYNLDYTTNHANPINSALQFLSDQAENFGGEEVVANLSHTTIKSGLSGNHLHFQQHYQHIPVFQATVNVSLDKSNAVRMVTSNLHDNFALPSTTPTLTASEAIQLGRQVIGYSGKEMADPSSQLYGFRDQKRTDHLVWVVNLYPYSPAGDWTIIVDANDGSVLEIQDNAIHENGSGMIFNPDPLTTAEANYAGNYRDFNDQDNEELNAERYLVNLLNITETDGIYTLDGPWVRIFDFEEPIDPPVTAIHPDSFIFTRSESGFEDVNVYYHLDYAQRHLQALGFNNIQNAPILVDPHGLDGQDQSHYLGGMNRLAFGEGGVDDAEDADVIYHEYGHAIQYDQVPNWGGGHCGAMGEGFGDYWAGTFSARLSDYRNNWVFNWDGHNAFWNGRVLDYNGVYPDDWLGGFDIHHDGQIWSACLWEIREQIGADIMDAIVIDHHFYLNRNATVEDAAQALLLVDEINYDGLYQTTIGQACYDRGFINEVPIFGAINGHVQDAANDNPLQAQITLTQDDQTYTIFSNEEGYFFYSPLSVGFWDVESLVDGFSPWNETVEIAEDDTLDLTIYMGQPLLEMEDELLELEMYIDSELDTFLILENVGSGMAAWNFRFRQQGVAEIEPWELETQISISDACGETQLQGSTVAGGNIIISGANNGQNPNKLYFFDYTGEYLQ